MPFTRFGASAKEFLRLAEYAKKFEFLEIDIEKAFRLVFNENLREIAGISPCQHRELRVSCGDTSIHHFQRTSEEEGWKILRLNDMAHLA
jgi:hypothetical protein